MKSTPGMLVLTIHDKNEEKRKPGKKNRRKDNIPVLLYTESEIKRRKIKTQKEEVIWKDKT